MIDITRLQKRFLEKSVPRKMRHSGKLETIIRARVLASLFISNIIICTFLLLFMVTAHLLTDQSYMQGVIVTLCAFLLIALEIYIFYKSRDIKLIATIFSMTFFAGSLAGTVVSGGWHSPMLLLFFCSPAISFLVGGRYEGFYMSALVLGCGLGMMTAHLTGFQLFHFVEPEKIATVKFYTWVISLILLSSCLMIYDNLLNSIGNRVRRTL